MSDNGNVEEIANAAVRGVVGAMAMTGVRAFTVSAGLVEDAPPKTVLRKTTKPGAAGPGRLTAWLPG